MEKVAVICNSYKADLGTTITVLTSHILKQLGRSSI
jgi:hypothetical protein